MVWTYMSIDVCEMWCQVKCIRQISACLCVWTRRILFTNDSEDDRRWSRRKFNNSLIIPLDYINLD